MKQSSEHYCATFDSNSAVTIRGSLYTYGYVEGRHYRIGMTEQRHTLGLRFLGANKQDETLFLMVVNRILAKGT